MNLHEKQVQEELKLINFPAPDWVKKTSGVLDVAIVGAGMAGIAAALALLQKGVSHFQIYDENERGEEGPWVTYARMRHLRSTKELTGPALNIPSLTFQRWYTALNGEEKWDKLQKIPNSVWMDYLNWLRQTLKLPVTNGARLDQLSFVDGRFKLQFSTGEVFARKVVLATGRAGFGGPYVPSWTKQFPREMYAHTSDKIDFEKLVGKEVGVIGVGASAFDAAATALEKGASSVQMLMRRKEMAQVNKLAHTVYGGFSEGYYYLPDSFKLQIMQEAREKGAVPPHESLDRMKGLSGFHFLKGIEIQTAKVNGQKWVLSTNQGEKQFDFLIFATVFEMNAPKVPYLQSFVDKITLWKDKISPEEALRHPFAGSFPYVGPSFEFLGRADYLKDLYCFNYGASLSHALLSSDIPAIGTGAERLARGIAVGFFTSDPQYYLDDLKAFEWEEFSVNPYPWE